MEITVLQKPVTEASSDALVVGFYEGLELPEEGAAGDIDRALDGIVTELVSEGEIRGKLASTTIIHTHGKLGVRRVIVVGLGKRDELDGNRLRRAAASAAQQATTLNCTSLSTVLHRPGTAELTTSQAVRAVVEGTILGTYEFEGYKRDPDKETHGLEEFTLVEPDGSELDVVESAAGLGKLLAAATNRARDLANMPANELTPSVFARRAEDLAERVGLKCTVLDRSDMEREGMGLFLGVAKGSDEPPKLIVLTYEPEGDPQGAHV